VHCCIGTECFDRGIPGWATEAGQLRSAKINQALGCDTLWMDAAWFVGDFPNGVGNWEVKPKEFPRGLKPIADECHRLGLKWLIWWEPERVARDTRIARANAKFVLGGTLGGLFNLGDPRARRWMTDLLNRQIDEFGVDCFRNDFNMDPLSFWRASDKPDRQGIAEIRYIEGLYKMWDDIRARHPRIWLDDCASGGRRIDMELLKRAVVQTRSDSACAPGRADWDQCQSYGLSLYVPCHATIGWETDAYSVRSSATGGYCGEWDILNANFPMEQAKAAIAEVKENQKYFYGDYYPLSPWSIAASAWMACQFHRPDLDEGMVLAFRRKDCPHGEFPAKLRGLNPQRMYMVRFSDEQRTETRRTMRGNELAGMILRIEKPRNSLLVRYGPAHAISATRSRPLADPKGAGAAHTND
jgi:alpha-galactosidase